MPPREVLQRHKPCWHQTCWFRNPSPRQIAGPQLLQLISIVHDAQPVLVGGQPMQDHRHDFVLLLQQALGQLNPAGHHRESVMSVSYVAALAQSTIRYSSRGQ